MEPTPKGKSRPDAASVALVAVVCIAIACMIGVLLVWPFAFLYVAVSPAAAFLFVAGCFGLFALAAWRMVRGRRMGEPRA